MSDKCMVQLFTQNMPSADEAATAQKQAMEALYQQKRDQVTAEDCQRLEIQELYHTIFHEKGEGTLAEKLATLLEVDQEDQLDIGLDTLFNLVSETCSYDDVLNDTVLESATQAFLNFNDDQEDPEPWEYAHWRTGIVNEGEWVLDAPALFNRIGNFIELPSPCLIHKIEDDFVDVITRETLEKLV